MSFYVLALAAVSIFSFVFVLLLVKGLIKFVEFIQRKLTKSPTPTIAQDTKNSKITIQPISTDLVLNINNPPIENILHTVPTKRNFRKSQLAMVFQKRKWSGQNPDLEASTERTGLSATSLDIGRPATGSGSETPESHPHQIYRPDHQEFIDALNKLQIQNFKALSEDHDDSQDEASSPTSHYTPRTPNNKSIDEVEEDQEQEQEKTTLPDFRGLSNLKLEDAITNKQIGALKGEKNLGRKLGRTSLRLN